MCNTTRRFFLLGSIRALSSLFVVICAASAFAVTIPTVPVGDAGNTGEVQLQGTFGAVAYNYRIGTTEVTNAQYVEFLNAVAATDTYGLYNTNMGSNTHGGITRSGSGTMPDPYVYAVKADAGSYTYADKPVVYVSWYDSLRFANWLHNGQPGGAQDASTTEDGAYTFSGATSVGPRNSDAIWFLTSEDEWYKAAYYNGSSYYDYPTGTNTTPDNNLPSLDSGNSANFRDSDYTTGNSLYPMTDAGAYAQSTSPYGTFDQGGNVGEWNEAIIGSGGAFRSLRGGSWVDGSGFLQASVRLGTIGPTGESNSIGFRVATVPEPGTAVLAVLAAVGLLAFCFGRRAGKAFFPSTRLRLVRIMACAIVVLATAPLAFSATIIDTTPGDATISPFGEPVLATFGQTITAPAVDHILTSFTFLIDDFLDPDFVDFDAYVYAWDGSKATGAALFSAGPFSTTNNGGSDGFEAFTINTGNLALTPSASYVLFFSASNRFDTIAGSSYWSLHLNNPYSGGTLVYLDSGSDFGLLTTDPWDIPDPLYDLAFQATFVPEPSTLTLVCVGVSTVAGFMLRRRANRGRPQNSKAANRARRGFYYKTCRGPPDIQSGQKL